MSEDNSMPAWVEFIRSDLRDFRTEMNARMDKFVTEETLTARLAVLDGKIGGVGADLVKERESRIEGDTEEREAREAKTAELERRTAAIWSWIRWGVGTVIAAAGVFVAYITTVGR